MTKRLSKPSLRTLLTIGVALLVLATVIVVSLRQSTFTDCSDDRQDRMGECLPEGQCIAPTDAIVRCSLLEQNGDYNVEPNNEKGSS